MAKCHAIERTLKKIIVFLGEKNGFTKHFFTL